MNKEYEGSEYTGTAPYFYWYYSTGLRYKIEKKTSLVCDINEKKLNSKIGVLTIDEVSLAGANSTANTIYYLYDNAQNKEWWTLSVTDFSSADYGHSGGDTTYMINSNGGLYEILGGWLTYSAAYVRPTITLISGTVLTSGDGTISNPYIVE